MNRLLIVPAAGTGSRLGRSEPKALVPLLGRPLVARALDAFAGVAFARVVVVVPPGREPDFEAAVAGRAGLVAGDQTRTRSVRRGFESLEAAPGDLVCIHDAARPLVTAAEMLAVIAAAERSGAAIGATAIVDTVKRVESGRVVATLDRRGLFAAATPQVFRAEVLGRALAAWKDATDEATLVEENGLSVSVVPLSRFCFKITTPEDFEMAEAILRSREMGNGKRETT